jgi:arsenate reductase
MSDKIFHVLFLSRRNSARSILAEAVLNKVGKGRFVAHSAAVDPAAKIDPHVEELLKANDLHVSDTRPISTSYSRSAIRPLGNRCPNGLASR